MARRSTPATDPAESPATEATQPVAKSARAKAAEKAAAKTAAPKEPKPKKEAAPKAAAADSGERKTRRNFGGRNWLAREIEKNLRRAERGVKGYEFPMKVGTLRNLLTNSAGELPSTGAVSAAVQRWADQGYVKTNGARPLSVTGFTAKYSEAKGGSLDKFLADQKELRDKARAAAKAAA